MHVHDLYELISKCLKITLDESNYVLIEQETETNESEYSYVVVKNGKKVIKNFIDIIF